VTSGRMRLVFLNLILLFVACAQNLRPVVLMHGLLAGSEAMSHAQEWIAQDYPGMYIKNIEIGDGRTDSMFMQINKQVESFASQVLADPKLKNGFNLIGHSQGALISRAYIERYNNPKVYNYISWAGPHGGQYGIPELNEYCPDYLCPWLNDFMSLISEGAWTETWMQDNVAFATYWKDPFQYSDYLKYSSFLADINNEKPQKNSTYKQNIMSLNSILLIYSTEEEIVVPTTSPTFAFFKLGQESEVIPLRNTDQYVQDWLGLQTLDKNNKLFIQSVPCGHQDIPRDVCKPYYVKYTQALLNNTITI